MVMKNKNRIKQIILMQEKDEKKVKINLSDFNSKKLIRVLKKITGSTFKVKKIKMNNQREFDVTSLIYIKPQKDQEECLIFKCNDDIFVLDLGDENSQLLKKVLMVFDFVGTKLVPKEIRQGEFEDRYVIGKELYKINGFLINGEVIMRDNISLYTIDLKLCYWKYHNHSIQLQGLFLQNLTKNKFLFQELKDYVGVMDKQGRAYNQFFYGKSYLLFPVMTSGNYTDEIDNFGNIGYYLYNIFKKYVSEKTRN